jgi:hypothetical protein
MKVRYKVENLEVEVEGKDTKDTFAQIASAVEVFGNSKCGACDSPRTVPAVRESQGNVFYEMRCLDCGSALSFGQKRTDGTLFPKKKSKEGDYLPGNGWVRWQPKAMADEAF